MAVLLAGVLLASGCVTATTPGAATRPTLLNPRWEDRAFGRHLGFFEDVLADEGSSSEPVTAYVSDAMRASWLQPAVEGHYALRAGAERPWGYVGYVGGKHPLSVAEDRMGGPVATQAVLVCADLGEDELATSAAALLGVARVYGIASQYTLMPERSVIFALWPRPATRDDPLAGLRAYLRQPTWDLDRVRAVLYVGLPARLRAEVQSLLAEYDIPLQRVSPAFSGDASTGDGARPSAVGAAQHARDLAERTHRLLRAATLTGGKIMPALGDSIRVPRPRDETR